MRKNTLAYIAGLFNISALTVTLIAWLDYYPGTKTLIAYASFFAISAFLLMWAHYVVDAIRRAWFTNQKVGWQYKVTRWYVLAAILLHPALITAFIISKDLGSPIEGYKLLVGDEKVVFIFAGTLALSAFLAFEFKVFLEKRNLWRQTMHASNLAMFLVLVHSFSIGFIINGSAWFKLVWWFVAAGYFIAVSLLYNDYYKASTGRRYLSFISILVLSVAVIGAGLGWYDKNVSVANTQVNTVNVQQNSNQNSDLREIPKTELSKKDGKNGTSCWVAIEGTVYEINNSIYWVDGVHVTSGGRASCGRDLTEVLKDSPHGISVLGSLIVIGLFAS